MRWYKIIKTKTLNQIHEQTHQKESKDSPFVSASLEIPFVS